MRNLIDIIVYLFQTYPYPSQLSKARVVKLLYLIDWRSCLVRGIQVTNTKWLYNHYGPYVVSIVDTIKEDQRFETKWGINYYGEPKELIKLRSKSIKSIMISEDEKEIINFVIEKTSSLSWSEFINLVYDTYPVRSSVKYSYLKLPELAEEYKKSMRATKAT